MVKLFRRRNKSEEEQKEKSDRHNKRKERRRKRWKRVGKFFRKVGGGIRDATLLVAEGLVCLVALPFAGIYHVFYFISYLYVEFVFTPILIWYFWGRFL